MKYTHLAQFLRTVPEKGGRGTMVRRPLAGTRNGAASLSAEPFRTTPAAWSLPGYENRRECRRFSWENE
jgi:hypothetical protein